MALCRTSAKISYASFLRSFYPLAQDSEEPRSVLKLKKSSSLGPPPRIFRFAHSHASNGCTETRLLQLAYARSCSFHSYAVLCNATSKQSKKNPEKERTSVFQEIMKRKDRPNEMSLPRKAFELGKDLTFMVVVIGGLVVTGILFFNVAREFMSHESPSFIFSQALKRVQSDPQAIEALGEPISGYGEQSGKNRRRNIAHQEYVVDGETYMRLHFHVNGSKRKGTATIDLKKNEKGKYQCRFLMVEFAGGTIIVEDNR